MHHADPSEMWFHCSDFYYDFSQKLLRFRGPKIVRNTILGLGNLASLTGRDQCISLDIRHGTTTAISSAEVITTKHSKGIPLPQAMYVTEVDWQANLMTPNRKDHNRLRSTGLISGGRGHSQLNGYYIYIHHPDLDSSRKKFRGGQLSQCRNKLVTRALENATVTWGIIFPNLKEFPIRTKVITIGSLGLGLQTCPESC